MHCSFHNAFFLVAVKAKKRRAIYFSKKISTTVIPRSLSFFQIGVAGIPLVCVVTGRTVYTASLISFTLVSIKGKFFRKGRCVQMSSRGVRVYRDRHLFCTFPRIVAAAADVNHRYFCIFVPSCPHKGSCSPMGEVTATAGTGLRGGET